MPGIDIYQTWWMLNAVREKQPEYTFLLDRYFQTGAEDIFATKEVLVDYMDAEGHKIAPFVSERYGAVPYKRGGYRTYKLEPGHVSVSRPLTLDDLTSRQFGEAVFSARTPEERARLLLAGDLDALDRLISRREEWMAAMTMRDNAVDMSYLLDDVSKKKIPLRAAYYDEDQGDNPAELTPAVKWDNGGSWMDDVSAAAQDLADEGRPVSDLVVGSDVAQFILKDEKTHKLLDNRRIEIGTVDPRWQGNGVAYLGRLNFSGFDLDIFSYRGVYEDPDTGKIARHIDPDMAIVTAPGCGVLKYGAVTQMDHGDTMPRTYPERRVPKLNVDTAHNTRELILTSKPLTSPRYKNPWRTLKGCLTGA